MYIVNPESLFYIPQSRCHALHLDCSLIWVWGRITQSYPTKGVRELPIFMHIHLAEFRPCENCVQTSHLTLIAFPIFPRLLNPPLTNAILCTRDLFCTGSRYTHEP